MSPDTLIRKWESCKLQAYPDPASPLAKGQGTDGRPWTIGYGCTGPGIVQGLVWTQDQADAALTHRLVSVVDAIQSLVTVPLSADQLAALCSFEWNTGALHSSTLLKLLNTGDYLSAGGQFLHWEYAHHVFIQGLANRREDECIVFMSEYLG